MLHMRKLLHLQGITSIANLPKVPENVSYTILNHLLRRYKSGKAGQGSQDEGQSEISSCSSSLCEDNNSHKFVNAKDDDNNPFEFAVLDSDITNFVKKYGKGSDREAMALKNSKAEIVSVSDVLQTMKKDLSGHIERKSSQGQTEIALDFRHDSVDECNLESQFQIKKKKINSNSNKKLNVKRILISNREKHKLRRSDSSANSKKSKLTSSRNCTATKDQEDILSDATSKTLERYNLELQDSVVESESHVPRRNMLGIQTLSESLFNQIFSRLTPKATQEIEDDFQRSKDHLVSQGLWGKEPSVIPEYDFQLPTLRDRDLDQHFRIIAEEQCSPYKQLLGQLIDCIPAMPSDWQFTSGWTRYNPDGTCTSVPFPDCHCLVFDVEVCVNEGNHPVLAAAVSDKYWYSWCSRRLIQTHLDTGNEIEAEDLIPLESSSSVGVSERLNKAVPRVVVGHNVSYDRLRVREQYHLESTHIRFVDTMSLHIAVSGLVSEQRSLMLKNKNNSTKVRLPWMSVGCQNNLNSVYKFYCHCDEDLKKDTRNIFVSGSINDVRQQYQELMEYCANDVRATHMVLVKLLPLFFERFPHPVSFSGMLEMGSTFLPVRQNWSRYISAAEKEYHESEKLLNEELVKHAQAALEYRINDKYLNDPWLWNLDWSVPRGRVKKLPGYPNWYRKLCAYTGEREGTPEPENMSISLQVVPKLLRLTWKGFPLHYNEEYGWGYLKPLYRAVSEMKQPGDKISVVPNFPIEVFYEMFCNITSEGEFHNSHVLSKAEELEAPETEKEWEELLLRDGNLNNGKGARRKVIDNSDNKPNETLKDIGICGVGFVPLPHKNGPGNRVGNPLAKDFLSKLEDGTLSSHFRDVAELVLRTTKTLTYWRNNRDRILSQMVLWNDHKTFPQTVLTADDYNEDEKYGVILPAVVSAGTITRRAVEPTWMTASNAYVDRIGSELKSMIQTPPGYRFVGSDVDSQELWIAAILGDAYMTGEHGATALGWMTLQGKKSDGSDMHSRTASTAGISRDNAKVINYGRIYGAGLRFIKQLLKQFNPKFSDEETQERAAALFAATKGQKGWILNETGREMADALGYHLTGDPLTRKEINKILLQYKRKDIFVSFQDVVDGHPVWVGGSESHMFNCLEAIARSEEPKTPVLGARVTRALEPKYIDDQFMTSRVNWVVQSSAVDYLHLMLVCMRWLFEKYDINGRFCISIHDEVRYMVSTEDCYRAALALQITNLLTRSLFAIRLGFKDLPQSVAFFSSIDIDHVLRKEPHLDCVTPSNPDGLHKGYGIPPGESLDIQKILEVTAGTLQKMHD